MKQEDKELLFKDLCARLPYDMLADYRGEIKEVEGVTMFEEVILHDEYYPIPIEEVRPYLRPISSMTDEERKKCYHSYGDVLAERAMSSDYFNSIHMDYRNLIEQGLAIEAPKGMYN